MEQDKILIALEKLAKITEEKEMKGMGKFILKHPTASTVIGQGLNPPYGLIPYLAAKNRPYSKQELEAVFERGEGSIAKLLLHPGAGLPWTQERINATRTSGTKEAKALLKYYEGLISKNKKQINK